MLCCVYHPVQKFKVVEEDERDKLLGTGVWFNTPAEAEELKLNYEKEKRRKENGKELCETRKPRKRKTKESSRDDGQDA